MDDLISTYIRVWVALLTLLALTVAATFAPMEEWRVPANIGIAIAKAALIAWFFMHLHELGGIVRIVAVAAFVWLLILLLLSASDFATRHAKLIDDPRQTSDNCSPAAPFALSRTKLTCALRGPAS